MPNWRLVGPPSLRLGSLVLAVLLVGCGGTDQDDAKRGARTSWIAFVTDRDGNEEIYLMQPDGSELRNLTGHDKSDSHPSWSPDGSRIAFQSNRDGSEQIYVMNADGTAITKLTDTPGKKSTTAWSPDGQQIAFGATEGRDVLVYVVSADGGIPKKLIDGMAPSWSPDGTTLALNRGQLPLIYLMDSDGANARTVSPQDPLAHLFTLRPVWSPDGDRFLYTKALVEPDKGAPGMNYEIFTMDTKGQDRRRLTVNAGWDMGNGWSPDGGRIVFTSRRDGNGEIYVMNADGTAQENLTRHDANDQLAAWSRFVAK